MGAGWHRQRLIFELAKSRRYWLFGTLVCLAIGAGLAVWFWPKPPPKLTLAVARFDDLIGWRADKVGDAVPALLRSCGALSSKAEAAPLDPRPKGADFGRVGEWRRVCDLAALLPKSDQDVARRFFEAEFVPVGAGNNGDPEGLFTGYFEISLRGSRQQGGSFQTPLYRRPAEPSRFTRAEIEDGALAGQGLELLWVDDPIAAFFLEIQGSGRVQLPNGKVVRVGYDKSNGKPYVAVGRLLIDRGLLPREQVTMASIREWMKAHPKEGAALRRENPSYVFFRELTGDGPLGAQQVALTPERSLAVDRRFIALGIPVWLDAEQRYQPGVKIRQLVVTQDTGSAIRGPVRGDLFWGHGAIAADRAGAMNARGRYFLLLPKSVAERLTAPASIDQPPH